MTRSGFSSLLAVMMSWMGTPNFAAIEPSVSPSCTTYFCPAAGLAVGGGATVGGTGVGDGGTADGATDGAVEALGAVVVVVVVVPGAVVREGVAERIVTEGVTVALLPPGRVQALRTSTLPARPTTRPSCRSPSFGPIIPSFPSGCSRADTRFCGMSNDGRASVVVLQKGVRICQLRGVYVHRVPPVV